MKKVDLIAGAVLLVLSGYVIWAAERMPPSMTEAPGTGFFPFWVGVLLALASVILLVTAWRRPADLSEPSRFPRGKPLLMVGSSLLGLLFYISLLGVLGFVANTFLFVFYVIRVVERETWKLAAVTAVLTTAGLFIIFRVLLGVSLPRNLFGF